MSRIKRGFTKHRRHKKVLNMTKGFRGRASKCYKIAAIKVQKAMRYAYVHRKTKKREYRSLWILRINAAVREQGLKYSYFINAIKKLGITMDRKSLSNLAITNPAAFSVIVDKVKKIAA